MDVILLERIEKLGAIGDVVKVKNGYARNFLLPRGKALRANESNRKVFEANREKIEATTPSAAARPRPTRRGRRRQDPADPPGVEHRPALRLGLGPRPRRGAGGPGPQDRQEPDRARPADQGDRPPGGEDRAPPGSVGHDQGQRRPLARRGRAAGAGQRRDGRDVREGRGRASSRSATRRWSRARSLRRRAEEAAPPRRPLRHRRGAPTAEVTEAEAAEEDESADEA